MKLLNKLIAKQAKEITDIRLSYTTNYEVLHSYRSTYWDLYGLVQTRTLEPLFDEFILTKFAYFRKSWMIPPG